ncbi:MAG: DUF4184 family protein [Candidatus Thorarchaeota archaeon]|jgi:hypothetical protein
MPFTPLHYPLAYGLSKIDRRLSLPGLVVGSFIPDIEVIILRLFFPDLPDHLFMHSLLGVFTLCTVVAVVATRYLYPFFVSLLFGVKIGELQKACRISSSLILSCMVGGLFHVLVEIPLHPFNPILWPWVDPFEIVGILVLFFAAGGDIALGFAVSNLLVNAIMFVFGLLILKRHRRNGLWERVWLGTHKKN